MTNLIIFLFTLIITGVTVILVQTVITVGWLWFCLEIPPQKPNSDDGADT